MGEKDHVILSGHHPRLSGGRRHHIPDVVGFSYAGAYPALGVLLGSVHPGGFEGLFQGLPGADAETVKALFKKYNMDVVGPPLDVAMSPTRLAALRGAVAAAQPATKAYRIGVLAPGCHP